ncbi:hypothetical protein [Thomasclavelia cocleata]|uniref:hypothetical protein n=1 Tax=Thomasclavelia cocleata TaxID=69824 RepID=UPI00255AE2B5|nr:hypothetical protein [Thomasclavelia cocleata]
MQAKLLGVMKVNFTNSQNEAVQGTNLFVAFQDEAVEGLRCEKFFLKDSIALPKNTKINDVIDIIFNFKGKIEKVEQLN